MKNILLFFGILATGLLFLSSCSSHSYQTRSKNMNQTQIVLDRANFKVLGQTYGESSVIRVLGIGGVSRRAVEENAYASMMDNAALKGAQTVVNITFDTKCVGFPPFYWKTIVHAYGTVIEFVDPDKNEAGQ